MSYKWDREVNNMLYMEQIRGYPYMRKKQLMEEFQVSRSYVDRRVRGIEEEIKKGRYSPYVILHEMINVYAFMDYVKYEKALSDRNARKYVPEFAPNELAEICGFSQKVVEYKEATR